MGSLRIMADQIILAPEDHPGIYTIVLTPFLYFVGGHNLSPEIYVV